MKRMLNIIKIALIFILIGMLFISGGIGYVYASSGGSLRAPSLFQDKDRADQLLRYMYGGHEYPGKGVVVYRKNTPEKKGRQVVLPVYEITWIKENFNEEELRAVIDALNRWTYPVHDIVLSEMLDILLLKDDTPPKRD